MFVPRFRAAALALVASLGLAACSEDGYGYSSVALGYGGGGYYDPYYDDFGYGYSRPYYGWYNNYYYPGTGYYVYDRGGNRHRWNDNQRRYWAERNRTFRGADSRGERRELRENWRDFRQDRRVDDRAFRQERRQDRQAFRRGDVTRQQFRQDRRQDRREYRQEFRQDRRALRRENRQDRRN